MIGIDASYRLPMFKGSTDDGVGFTFIASRPKTDGTQFPVVAFDFGDTTFLYTVAQRTTLLQYGVQAQLGQSLGPVRLFGMGGGGFYTFLLDARQTLGNHRFTKPMVFGGGGLEYAVRRDIGLRVQVQDMVMTSFDRQRLDPTVKYSQDRRIMDVLPPPVAAKSTIHNLQTAIVFSYVPSRQIIGGGEQP